ncbi:hypothetical protein FSW04_09760 [Baekduia soli]|uniref:Uncharacterized protein n=1 Tax=Baekduia soli TaxID=496014 RepID=A0A5B8U417_9ACTN|nr:hypothetical protein FSW04_09760 [Baekduia soli]
MAVDPAGGALPAGSSAAPASTATAGSTTAPASATTPDGTLAPAPPGGGRVGLLLLSAFVKPGSTNISDSYNHYSLLRSIEDLFGLDHLGLAGDPSLPSFDKAVYNNAG